MSYDINLVNKEEDEIYYDNYTYNVASMFRDAIGGDGLYELYDKTSEECLCILENAISKMKKCPEYYEEMNPENGWGDYKGALNVLVKLHTACAENPYCKVIIS